MQIKNKKNILILSFVFLFLINFVLKAEEFNITAKEIIIEKDNEVLIGKDSVEAVDSKGQIIKADKIIYEKNKEYLLAEGNVQIFDLNGNILKSDKATYDKPNEIITTYDYTEAVLKEGYKLVSKNIFYDTKNEKISSVHNSVLTDIDGNIVRTTAFQYNIKDYLFSSVGKIEIIDVNKNKYFFKEIYVDTKKKEMIGSNISVVLDQKTFGVSEESDPRFVGNDVYVSQNKLTLSKGVFTVCKKRDGKCPPWSIKAKKIIHDKTKKTIYYEHATLKVYDIPVFYFPRFFHPDPTVKKQSGFLAPFFTNSTTMGTGFGLPYYWAIKNDRDLTFTPKVYAKDNILYLNEYRQAFRKGFLTLDTSYTEGHKTTSKLKTDGSRNHIFGNLDLNFNKDDTYDNNLSVKVQRTSNDTFFRTHDINTALVNSENTDLENEIKYSFSKDNMYFNVVTNVYEDLREKKNSDRYEYILPNIMYGKTFFTEKFGTIDFKSDALFTNYDTNKYKTFLTNDVIWNPTSFVKNSVVNKFVTLVRNTNYETKNTKEYKDGDTVNEINGVVAYEASLPMKKDGINYWNLFSPKFMIRYSPGHMRDLSKKNVALNYNNLYSLNKTAEIEEGLSAVLGFDYKINQKSGPTSDSNKERLSVSLGQVFTNEENKDMPSKSSLDQKMSDVVGEINYNFSEIGNIDYKFAVDHNLNALNYNEILTQLNFGKIKFNLDYLEQQNHVGDEHYVQSGISLNLNDNNLLSFSTKKNFKTDSTELYDLKYQYEIDCLKAGLVYRREFYHDTDSLEPKNSLMFTFTFVPFTSVNTPAIQP